MKNISICIFTSLVSLSGAANILVLLPFPAPSHFYCFYPLIEELNIRGHNVTIVSPFTVDNGDINHISLEGVHEYFPSSFTELRKKSRLMLMLALHDIVDVFIKGSFTHPNFQSLIHDNSSTFDLLIMELYYSETYLALAEKFNVPVVALVPQAMQPITGWHISNPISFSYIPTMFLPFSAHMSFVQRLLNTILGTVHMLFYQLKQMPNHQTNVEREFYFLAEQNRNVRKMLKRISLTLVNTHYSYFPTRPYLPNTVEVGGIHIKKLKPLPKTLQTFMDNSKNGVVFISFGTMVKPAEVDSWASTIIEVFDKLSIRVVWKWKPDLLQNISEKYFIREWLPQNDILNHANCKLFVTHGGIHSIIESINAAVPLLGMPLFSDQPFNIAVMEKLGVGLGLQSMEKDDLENAVNRILTEPTFKERINYRSKLFKNRISDPVHTAAFWIEHVLEHKGASHLKSAAEELSWFEYFLIDVILFIFVLLIIFIYFLRFTLILLLNVIKRFMKMNSTYLSTHNFKKKIT